MTNTQTTDYPDDEHLPDCASWRGVQYACGCGYAFRKIIIGEKKQVGRYYAEYVRLP